MKSGPPDPLPGKTQKKLQKKSSLGGRTCNPLMPVQSKHSFQCSDFSYFRHQICPTFGSSCAPFRPQCLKKAVLKITQKSTLKKYRKCSKMTSFGTPCGGAPSHFFDGFWHPGPRWCPRCLQGGPRGAQSQPKYQLLLIFG